MNKINKAYVILAILLFSAGYCSAQGLYWESKISGGPMGDNAKESKFYYMPKMFKSLDVEKNEATIFRLDKKLFVTIDYEEKVYSELTFDEMDSVMTKMSVKMDSKMAELQKQMESMPEEQRKMMEKMLGDKMPGFKKDPKVEVEKTEETQKIAGYNCTKFIVKMDDKDFMNVWTTQAVHTMGLMKDDMKEYSLKMAQSMPMNGGAIAKAFQKIDGFPMLTEVMGVNNIVTKIEKKNTEAAEFEVPDGFKKEKSPLLDMKR